MPRGRAVVLDRPLGTFSIEEFPVPDPAPGTVLLSMELCGCCATDAHTYLGQWKNARFPALLGHENVGSVHALGAGGQRDYLGRELQPGDRVFARWGWCGQCYECRSLQQPRRCRNRTISYGGMSVDGPFSGGLAEYLYLSAPATTFGADVVVDIDRVRKPEERTRAVLAETPGGLGADLVFGCVGLAPAWLEGISYVRDGGRFMELGLASDTGDVSFNPSTQLVARNITLMGTLGLESYQDAVVAGRIMEQRQLPLERLVSHQLPLERVGDAIQALNSNFTVDGRTAIKIAIAPNGTVG